MRPSLSIFFLIALLAASAHAQEAESADAAEKRKAFLRAKEEMQEVEVTEVELLAEIRDLLVAQNGGPSATPPPSTPTL